MLPLSTTRIPIYGQQRPFQPPPRPVQLSSVAFVEPTGEESQSLPWTYQTMPPVAIQNPYYPPCQYIPHQDSMPSSQICESMDISYNVDPMSTIVKNPNCVSQEAILAEIVRECEMIERNSSPERGSSPSTGYSSEDSDDVPLFGKVPAKRERKKAQNREAATRYREKKRKERDVARATVDGLLDRNDELRTKVAAIQGEIDYLKKLMAEIGMSKDDVQYISPIVPL